MNHEEMTNVKRKEQLKNVVEKYFESFRTKSFDSIPYSEEVVLKAPIVPGGVHSPLKGKQELLTKWWQPLEPALEGINIKIIDRFYNDSLTGVIAKADFTLAGPGITLRVADMFFVNNEGKIIEQENHFDASPLRS